MKIASPNTLPMLAILLTACAASASPTPTLLSPGPASHTATGIENDDSAIYAAAIRQMITVDNSFGDGPPSFWNTVYVLSTTDDTPVGPPEVESNPIAISANTQQAITDQLADLPLDTLWIASKNEAPPETDGGLINEGHAVIITLSSIHRQEDGSAQVFVWLYCANLCGIGKTYILEQIRGTWQVTGDKGTTIMS